MSLVTDYNGQLTPAKIVGLIQKLYVLAFFLTDHLTTLPGFCRTGCKFERTAVANGSPTSKLISCRLGSQYKEKSVCLGMQEGQEVLRIYLTLIDVYRIHLNYFLSLFSLKIKEKLDSFSFFLCSHLKAGL